MRNLKFGFKLRRGFVLPGVMLVLAGCSSVPRPAPVVERQAVPPASSAAQPAPGRALSKAGGGYYKDDGPGDNPPPNLDAIPDATPRVEPMHRFANRPYIALGQSYTPDTEWRPYRENGMASWYGRRYHGQRTSSGEAYDMYGMTAAHCTLPIPSYARVTNLANNKSVVVRINDRGPFHSDRLIDLSYTAAYKLGILQNGSLQVRVEALDARGQALPAPPEKPRLEATSVPVAASRAAPAVTTSSESGGVYVQLGAFSVQDNAEQFRRKIGMELAQLDEKLQVLPTGNMFKVRAGPYSTPLEAGQAVAEIRKALNISAVVIPR